MAQNRLYLQLVWCVSGAYMSSFAKLCAKSFIDLRCKDRKYSVERYRKIQKYFCKDVIFIKSK